MTKASSAATYAYRCNGESRDAWGVTGCQSDRVSQTVNGVTTNYVLDLASPLTQVLSDGTNTYVYGVGHIAQMNGASAEYFLTDGLGSVRQLVDSNGAVTMAKSYQPYGAEASSAGSGLSSYGFTGEMTDPTGLIYLRARYLSPNDGRFLTRDTWAGDENTPISYNRWVYASAQPITNVDPSGLSDYSLLFANFHDDYDDKHKSAPRWTSQEMAGISHALANIAVAYAKAYNHELAKNGTIDDCPPTYELYIDPATPKIDPFTAFYGVHGGNVTFDLISGSPGYWGQWHAPNEVYIYTGINWNYLLQHNGYLDRFITHEMGHVFENVYMDTLHTSSYPLATAMNREGITDRVGFAGGYLEWQWSDRNLNYEIFADMYVGWVFNSWAMKPTNINDRYYNSKLHIYEEGLRKSSFMDTNMPKWITEIILHK